MTGGVYALQSINSQEQERLLSEDPDWDSSTRNSIAMEPTISQTNGKLGAAAEVQDIPQSAGSIPNEDSSALTGSVAEFRSPNPPQEYRVYKRRWFGLLQLVLLNIIVSWDVSALIHYMYGEV
jgi:hypothetical protein